jgi:arabinofuranosyltransferase
MNASPMLRRALLATIALAAALHAASFAGAGPADDDFIVYRYARNLAEGLGPVFQPGERVEGYSAPGWMLAVSAALRLGADAPQFAFVVSALSLAVATLSVGRLWSRRHPADPTYAPALLVAASPALAWHAVQGLGTVPVAALIALGFDLWDRALRAGRSTLPAAAVLGLASLVRNEAVLFVLPFALAEARRRELAPAVTAFVPIAAWQAFRVGYYGDWLPNTYTAKKLPFLEDLGRGLEYLTMSNATTGIAVALALSTVAFVRRRGEAQDLVLRAAAAGAIAYGAFVVYAGGDFEPLARFFVPILPIALLLACEGGLALAAEQRKLAVAALVAAFAFEQVAQRERASLSESHELSEVRWAKIGREAARRLPPGTKVALSPIGAFGYESRLPLVDVLGLTNREVAAAPPDLSIGVKGHHRHDGAWVLSQQPEMIVLGNGWLRTDASGITKLEANPWERSIVLDPAFERDYEALAIDVEGSYPLVFHWRRGVPRPLGARAP